MSTSIKALLKYVTVHIIPPFAAGVATWLAIHVHALASLGLGTNAIAHAITVAAVYVATLAATLFTQHNVLSGKYAPLNRGKGAVPLQSRDLL